MKHKLWSSLLLLALTLCPVALASTTWYVDGVHGSDNNDCKTPQTACKTIGHAISLASSGDSIMVAAATYTENLSIKISLKVIGAGAKTTIIDGRAAGTVVTTDATGVILSNVSIRNGHATSGGGINLHGGILTVRHCTIAGNYASGDGGFGGGGIYINPGRLTISNSTISGNSALGTGGIYNLGGNVTISNSTISGNSADFGGSGIRSNSGTLTISNSTISGNTRVGPAIIGTATLQNSIVANSDGNCVGTMTSLGYNLSSDNTCHFNGPGDLNNTDPVLGTLGNYGGPTQTIPLLSGSPAIDAGNPNSCTDGNNHLLKTDQRGKPRPDKEDETGCDMGAYERQKD